MTTSQKRAALSRGFRYVLAGAAWEGRAHADIDLIPGNARFDQVIIARKSGLSFMAPRTIIPIDVHTTDAGRGPAWPVVQTVFDPSIQAARVFLGNERVHRQYRGHRQFQEDMGVWFGVATGEEAAPRGDGAFSLVLVQIR